MSYQSANYPSAMCLVASRRVRGFTLIEVLLATFIIAIGVLGLLALFAGAARQQQAATQSTVALFAASNAESGLIQNFGALTIPPGSNSNFTDNVWYALPMNPTHHYLTVDPNGTGQNAYFLTPSSVSLPRNLYTRAFGSPVQEDDPSTPTVIGFFDPPPAPFDDMSDIGQRRVDPSTLRIRVATSRVSTGVDPPERQPPVELDFQRNPGVVYPSDMGFPDPTQAIFTLNGDVTQDPDDPTSVPKNYIIVECELNANGATNARIVAIQIEDLLDAAPFSAGLIDSIDVVEFRWRNDQLSSLNDRIVFRPDPSSPSGRRPDQAYSLVFRRTALGFQTALFMYELGATSSSAIYVPPERTSDIASGVSPLRKAQLLLRYDEETEEYYFLSSDEATDWAVSFGQILLVSGVHGNLNAPGSDTPIRITRQEREAIGNEGLRGYLDRAPRFNNRAMLPIAQRPSGIQLTVIAVSDSVRSIEDGSVWKLRPLESRVIQVPIGN